MPSVLSAIGWTPRYALALTVVGAATAHAQRAAAPASSKPFSTAAGEWPSYGGDTRGSRYSPLDQIGAANFSSLEVAWRFKTDSLGPRPEFKLESTPLVVGGVLYTTGGTNRAVVALDAVTGVQRWVHREDEGPRGAAAALGPRARVLDRWSRRANPLRHTGLPPHRARRKDGKARPGLRRERRRGPQDRHRSDDPARSRHRRDRLSGRAGRRPRRHRHRRGIPRRHRAAKLQE